MPGKLNIKNISKNSLKIELNPSINHESTPEYSKIITTDEDVNISVKGGTKMLIIYDNNKKMWRGIIPSYGFLQITIDAQGDKYYVKYGDRELVNLDKNIESNKECNSNSVLYSIILCIIMLIFIILFWYYF